MAQNIYDNQSFFDGYSTLPRSVGGLDSAPEWPALLALLPAIKGCRVLDLGCGFGWFCRWADEKGALSVEGIDLSEKMLARAKADTKEPSIRYRQADLERVELAASAFDLIYSSLTLHYIKDLAALFDKIYKALATDGKFVFSIEHPLFTAPNHPDWITGPQGSEVWPLDNYLLEGDRLTNWFADGVIKQHRTVGTYINLLIQAGFSIDQVNEWGPTAEQIAEHPEWLRERSRPPFLLVSCKKS